MSNYVKLAAEAGDQYLNFLTESQEQFLKMLGTANAWVPAMPAMTVPPGLDIPTPKEVAEANFAFAAKLVKQQKAFTEKLFSTLTPEKDK